MSEIAKWKFCIDVGGTFTDCIAQSPSGEIIRRKLLSSSSFSFAIDSISGSAASHTSIQSSKLSQFVDGFFTGYHCDLLGGNGQVAGKGIVKESAGDSLKVDLESTIPHNSDGVLSVRLSTSQPSPIVAIRWVLGLKITDPLPAVDLRLGTTKGTNALLTRTGSPAALVTNKGFRQAVEIGDQRRPDLFALDIQKPKSLVLKSVEISGRLSTNGEELVPVDRQEIRQVLLELKESGIESLAVCLINSYANSDHEEVVGRIAEEIGFKNISLSSRVSPLIHYQRRASTVIVDSYLNPILDKYLAEIDEFLGSSGNLLVMTSSGALVKREDFSGKDSLLSGPAGGVVGFASVAKRAGYDNAIGFDMGGTSTDVSRLEGRVSMKSRTEKFGYDIQSPSLEIETVAAGGGSICRFDGWRLLVGPESAGADPGPACYGNGGPITVTDCNVWLKRIDPKRFPVPLDMSAVKSGLQKITDRMKDSQNIDLSLEKLATSFLEIANSHMATAIKTVTTRIGLDPRDFLLVAFGGAAAQNACGVASLLGMEKILLNSDAGILSAVGMGEAKRGFQEVDGIGKVLSPESGQHLLDRLKEMTTECEQKVALQFGKMTGPDIRYRIDVCIKNTQQILTVETGDLNDLENQQWIRGEFWRLYQKQYGFRLDRELELLSARIVVEVDAGGLKVHGSAEESNKNVSSGNELNSSDRFVDLDQLASHGASIQGPAVLTHPLTTVWLEEGWQVEVIGEGQYLLSDQRSANGREVERTTESTERQSWDPLQLELFHHRVTEIATQMGLALEANCTSVNVKERLDFSCAVFDCCGDLIVNAPHIPVHLGAMSQSVKEVINGEFSIEPGDCFLTNDPFGGGSHLPDVTVISPFFCTGSSEPDFWVACRAHHSEIGGITPGSMPPFSKKLSEEGVLFPLQKIIQSGELQLTQIERQLSEARFPSRNVPENLQDIQAQISANQMGLQLLQDFCDKQGLEFVKSYAGFILQASASQAESAISNLPQGERVFEDRLDCGLTIRLKAVVEGSKLSLDFSGTDLPQENNFNANRSIVESAVLYCLRLLIPGEIPLNQGLLKAVEIHLPYCFLNPIADRETEKEWPAVVGGNVETSQRIVDVILGVFGIAAASQGTMNNFLFGNDQFGFYETIGGGAGATANSNGADAVHTHMTNTRLTDPEILEQRYPVRLSEFSIREGSGGDGKQKGGDGMIRRFEFLEPLTVSLVTNRRTTSPYGQEGGEFGKHGKNLLINANGSREELQSSCEVKVQSGDQIEVRTPGGGGFGALD